MRRLVFIFLMVVSSCLADEIEVSSWTELAALGASPSVFYNYDIKLTSDLTSADDDYGDYGGNWAPLFNDTYEYIGDFYGQGHEIEGLTISAGAAYSEPLGLMAYGNVCSFQNLTIRNGSITNSGTSNDSETGFLVGDVDRIEIQNVDIVDCSIETGETVVGFYCGLVGDIKISDCSFSGTMVCDYRFNGGIAGRLSCSMGVDSTINNVHGDFTITGDGTRAGGLFGAITSNINNVEISNCSTKGSINLDTETSYYGGGLIGYITPINGSITIYDSYSDMDIYVYKGYVGGLIGYIFDSDPVYSNKVHIDRCMSLGDVEATSNNPIGGFIGQIRQALITVDNCFSRGDVTHTSIYYAGGFCGYVAGDSSQTSEFTNCYSTGTVTGTVKGGFICRLDAAGADPTVTDCFWDTETSNCATSASDATGKTTAEMKDVATFTDVTTVGLATAWDFDGNPNDDSANNDYWDIAGDNVNDGYPFLDSLRSYFGGVGGGMWIDSYGSWLN